MQISHRERVQSYQLKHNPPSPDEYVLLLLESLRSGKEEPDQHEENQGGSDGRNTEN